MIVGKRIELLIERPFNFIVRLPSPYNRKQIDEHVALMSEKQRADLEIVTFEVVSVEPVAKRDTIPAPPLSVEEFAELIEGEG